MKRSFLEKIYLGEIIPCERSLRLNKKMLEMTELADEAYEEMRQAVPEEYHDVIEKYISISSSLCLESELAAFIYGIRYIARFTQEAVTDKCAEFDDDELY